ncbi:MAG TPA: tetratricopeptide repeat protein [Burkholderiaceae bacterium]|nr:tetratricopeptide repeat protein [Burkholderiaceae bacterium]
MLSQAAVTTFLFTDIEGSTRLWECEPERMRPALARHDAMARKAVEDHHGVVVKMTGDGLHAAFDDPTDGIAAALELQQALADPAATGGVQLLVRCGLHAGLNERRDNDFFGSQVNRAARIMSVAHGGQTLVSQTVAELVRERLPTGASLRDLGTVRLRDLSAPERVWQLTAPGLRTDFPALRSLEATPNNLPQQLTTFVGRESEIVELGKMLAATRLLTLCGMGGLGKTRLSLQLAAELVDGYADGVWFVELAPLTDERLVPQAVASVLGVKEEAGRAVVEALVRFVRDRNLLVVLDNCEHLVHACAELAVQLLQAGPGVKIVATSRESLQVRGETIYPVPTLALPGSNRASAPDALLHYEAVRMFVDRACAAQPRFRLTERNAAAVTEICQRLDGIPLALELAAARMRSLSVESIAARLQDRFRLLAGGDRTALPRQQTLRALIDWSYDLLSEAERILFRRLAVFVGGWTLDAAEAVCAGGEIVGTDVLELLTRLVDKSLVAVESETGRFRLLETVRQYAQERLLEAGEELPTRDRHRAFYVDFAEQARPQLLGPQQGAWLARIDLDRENLLYAHSSCVSDEHAGAMGLQLVTALKQYFLRRGLLGLAQRVMVEALSHPGAQKRDAERSRALFSLGQICNFMGRYREASGHLEESLAIGREIGDRRRVASALQALGIVLIGQNDLVGARKYFDESLALEQEIGNKLSIASALNNRAQLYRLEGELDAAQRLYEQVLDVVRELGDHEDIAITLLNLAMIHIGRGAADRARGMLLETLAIAVETQSKSASQSVFEVSAGLAAAEGDWEQAARCYGVAESLSAQTGYRRDPVDDAFLAPLLQRARSMLPGARFDVAGQAGRALSVEEALAEARTWLSPRTDEAPVKSEN